MKRDRNSQKDRRESVRERKNRHPYKYTYILADRQIDRLKDRETDIQTDRKTDLQTDKQTHKPTDIQTYT